MMERVVITGVGPVTSIGSGKQDFWDALSAGRDGFGPITLCDASSSPSKVASEVKYFRLEHYVDRGRALSRHLPRAVQFGLAASELALRDAGLHGKDALDPDRCGVYVGTSAGNPGETFAAHKKWLSGDYRVPPELTFHLFNHSAACFLSSHFNLRGPIHTTTSGCNSGLDAIGAAYPLIALGKADAMLVVATDCMVTPELLAALNASNTLSTRYNEEPSRASRPFDSGRDGSVIGEGAAALLLESESHALARKAAIYAQVSGYAVCAVGNHRRYSHDKPEPDLKPCIRAFRQAMKEANWGPQDADLINANGSSSIIYDRLEAVALAEIFGSRFATLPVHSIKSMLGQHGAGSSALQAITACLSIQSGIVPPTINCEAPDPLCGQIHLITKPETRNPKRILAHSIGMGGFYYSCAALEAYHPVIMDRQRKEEL